QWLVTGQSDVIAGACSARLVLVGARTPEGDVVWVVVDTGDRERGVAGRSGSPESDTGDRERGVAGRSGSPESGTDQPTATVDPACGTDLVTDVGTLRLADYRAVDVLTGIDPDRAASVAVGLVASSTAGIAQWCVEA